MFRRWPIVAALALILSFLPPAYLAAVPDREEPRPGAVLAQAPIHGGVQSFLERQGSVLAGATFGDYTAAEVIEGYTSYYSLNPRVVLTLLELVSGLISKAEADQDTLQRPLSTVGPKGFAEHIEWAVRELRAGLGPYTDPPTATFVDGSSREIAQEQSPEMIAVALFLAKGRTETEWRALMLRYATVYDQLFADEPAPPVATPVAVVPFLTDPWPTGTRVIHSSWFDHVYPMVDVEGDGNEVMVDYLGRGGLSYNGHDGHDFYFPDQPYGTPILAAAPGWAYARTARGNGVVIRHTGAAEGYETVYWHLDEFAPIFKGRIDGDDPIWVERGAFVGTSGSSGFTNGAPHLHFEVRHNGKQVDPFGWYGPGEDPCVLYFACEASVWLWKSSSIWPRPDGHAVEDKTPPAGLLTVNPEPDLLFAASFDQAALPDIGAGLVYARGASREDGRFGKAVRVAPQANLSYPISGNLELESGTLGFWTLVPEEYPATSTGRNYLIAASEHPDDPARVYSNTFALRYEAARDNYAPRWSFWTVSEDGRSHSLSVLDQLEPGWHHFALAWSQDNGTKTLFIDGQLVATTTAAALPAQLTGRLELGRWFLESGVSDVRIDDLAIWRGVLPETRIVELAGAESPLQIGASSVQSRSLYMVTQARDDGGGIVQVQLGINGQFSGPLPYYSAYRWQLPAEEGTHEIAVRYVDRAGNTTTITRSVELNYPPQGTLQLIDSTPLTATVAVSATDSQGPLEVLLSSNRDGSDGTWQPLSETFEWRWPAEADRRILYVRFRDGQGAESEPLPLLPDGPRTYIPLVVR